MRELEKRIKYDLESGLISQGGGYKVIDLVKKYIALRTDVRENTIVNYNYIMNIIRKEETFGNKRIDTVKISDAKEFLIKLGKEGKGRNTVRNVRDVLGPTFELAVRDVLVRKNPFGFPLAEVVKNEYERREALTKQDEKFF